MTQTTTMSVSVSTPSSAPCPHAPRPPNRSAHDKLVEDLCDQLSAKEDRRRFLHDRHRGLKDTLSRVRADRDSCTEERNRVDEALLKVNKEVNARSEQAQKLRAGLQYLSEDRINEQIKILEDQMMKYHYKRTEENKIILEVNRLKRSKKSLKEYNTLKVSDEVMPLK